MPRPVRTVRPVGTNFSCQQRVASTHTSSNDSLHLFIVPIIGGAEEPLPNRVACALQKIGLSGAERELKSKGVCDLDGWTLGGMN